MNEPHEIIYARVPARLRLSERLKAIREEHSWPKPSIAHLVGILLDQALTANEPAPPKAKRAKKARRR